MADGSPNPFTTVTNFSKILALILFILLPFGGFYLGTKYQKAITVFPEQDVNLSAKNTKTPQNNSLKLEFKDVTATLERQSVDTASQTFFDRTVKKVEGSVINDLPTSNLFTLPMGPYLYYSSQTDSFYDLQPGGYSVLRLADEKGFSSLSKDYEKTDSASHTKTKVSCSTFHYPVGSVDAVAVSCSTNVTNLDTGFGDQSTTANCYIPLETGTYLAFEQKVKPVRATLKNGIAKYYVAKKFAFNPRAFHCARTLEGL